MAPGRTNVSAGPIEADKNRSQSSEAADIITYLAAPNTVNTLNPQVALATGKLFRLYIPHLSDEQRYMLYARIWMRIQLYTMNPIFWLLPIDLGSVIDKPFEVIDASSWILNQHSIDNIVKQFDPKTGEAIKYDQVISWPSFISNAVVSSMFTLKPNGLLESFLNSSESIMEAKIYMLPGYKVENHAMSPKPPRP